MRPHAAIVALLLFSTAFPLDVKKEITKHAEDYASDTISEAFSRIPSAFDLLGAVWNLAKRHAELLNPNPFSREAFELAANAARLPLPVAGVGGTEEYATASASARAHAGTYLAARATCPLTPDAWANILGANPLALIFSGGCSIAAEEYGKTISGWSSSVSAGSAIVEDLIGDIRSDASSLVELGARFHGYAGPASAELSRSLGVLQRLEAADERAADCDRDAEAAAMCFNLNSRSAAEGGYSEEVALLGYVLGSGEGTFLLEMSELHDELTQAIAGFGQEADASLENARHELEQAEAALDQLREQDASLVGAVAVKRLAPLLATESILLGSSSPPSQQLAEFEIDVSGMSASLRELESLRSSSSPTRLGKVVVEANDLSQETNRIYQDASRTLYSLSQMSEQGLEALRDRLATPLSTDLTVQLSDRLSRARSAKTPGKAIAALSDAVELYNLMSESPQKSASGLLSRASELVSTARDNGIDVSQEAALVSALRKSDDPLLYRQVVASAAGINSLLESKLAFLQRDAEKRRSKITDLVASLEMVRADPNAGMLIDTSVLEGVREVLNSTTEVDPLTYSAKLASQYDSITSRLQGQLNSTLGAFLLSQKPALIPDAPITCNAPTTGNLSYKFKNELRVPIPSASLQAAGLPTIRTRPLLPGESQSLFAPFNGVALNCSISARITRADESSALLTVKVKLVPAACLSAAIDLPQAAYSITRGSGIRLGGSRMEATGICQPLEVELAGTARSPLVVAINSTFSPSKRYTQSYMFTVTNNGTLEVENAAIVKKLGSQFFTFNLSGLGAFETRLVERAAYYQNFSFEAEQLLFDINRLAALLELNNSSAALIELESIKQLYADEDPSLISRSVALRQSLESKLNERSRNAAERGEFEADLALFDSLAQELSHLVGNNSTQLAEAAAAYRKAQGLRQSAQSFALAGSFQEAGKAIKSALSELERARQLYDKATRSRNSGARLELLANAVSRLCLVGSCSKSSFLLSELRDAAGAPTTSLEEALKQETGAAISSMLAAFSGLENAYKNYTRALESDPSSNGTSVVTLSAGADAKQRYRHLRLVRDTLSQGEPAGALENSFKRFDYELVKDFASDSKSLAAEMSSVTASLASLAESQLEIARDAQKRAGNRASLAGDLNRAKDYLGEGRYSRSIALSRKLMGEASPDNSFPWLPVLGVAATIAAGIFLFRRPHSDTESEELDDWLTNPDS